MLNTLVWMAAASVALSSGTDEEARLPYWQATSAAVSVRLVQRLPDQTRGFFQARGFSVEDADRIAHSCVFQTIFRNTTERTPHSVPVTYNLREWMVHHAGRRQSLKTREDWQVEWRARRASAAAQVAFEWSLLPTQQRYLPGDYNWGMTVFNLAPGAVFDLELVWHEGGVKRSAVIREIQCAPDEQRDPEAP